MIRKSRRAYLAWIGTTGVAAMAGCTGDSDDVGPETHDGPESEDGADGGDRDESGNSNGDDGTSDSDGSDSDTTDSDGEASDGDGESGIDGEVDAVVGGLVEGEEMQLVVEEFDRGIDIGAIVDPEPGNEYATAVAALKNTSGEFVDVTGLLQTRIRDEEGDSYDQMFLGGYEPAFNEGQVAPGEVERAAINFEIPEDATGLELVWEFTVGAFPDLDQAVVGLEAETDGPTLEQDLRADVHDVGTAVEFGSVEVTVEDVRTETRVGSSTEPDPGNEFLLVDITVENRTGEERWVSPSMQTLIKDDRGWNYRQAVTASTQLDRGFDRGSPVAHDESRRGEFVYEVEEGTSPLHWVFEFSLWTDGDKAFWQVR